MRHCRSKLSSATVFGCGFVIRVNIYVRLFDIVIHSNGIDVPVAAAGFIIQSRVIIKIQCDSYTGCA